MRLDLATSCPPADGPLPPTVNAARKAGKMWDLPAGNGASQPHGSPLATIPIEIGFAGHAPSRAPASKSSGK